MYRCIITITAIMISLLLPGCRLFIPYQPDVQQGNEINQTMTSQLKLGMTPTQVQQVMQGQAVLVDTFSPQQMIYVYTFRPGKGQTSEKKLVLTFANNKLVHIDNAPVSQHK